MAGGTERRGRGKSMAMGLAEKNQRDVADGNSARRNHIENFRRRHGSGRDFSREPLRPAQLTDRVAAVMKFSAARSRRKVACYGTVRSFDSRLDGSFNLEGEGRKTLSGWPTDRKSTRLNSSHVSE